VGGLRRNSLRHKNSPRKEIWDVIGNKDYARSGDYDRQEGRAVGGGEKNPSRQEEFSGTRDFLGVARRDESFRLDNWREDILKRKGDNNPNPGLQERRREIDPRARESEVDIRYVGKE